MNLNEEIQRQRKLMNLNEDVGKQGIPLERLPEEDQQIFHQIFQGAEIRGASSPTYNGNYIKVREVKRWESPQGISMKEQIAKQVEAFNAQSKNYTMKIEGYNDFEWEPDYDNYWLAAVMFSFYPHAGEGQMQLPV